MLFKYKFILSLNSLLMHMTHFAQKNLLFKNLCHTSKRPLEL